MSIRTIVEFNHDYTHRIVEDPKRFMDLLHTYLNGADQDIAEEMRGRYGMTFAPHCHHSTERKVVIYGKDYPL